jgi:hypothetical protein
MTPRPVPSAPPNLGVPESHTINPWTQTVTADLTPEKVILLGGPWHGTILVRPEGGRRIHTVDLFRPIAATYLITEDHDDEHGLRIARHDETTLSDDQE